MEIRTAENRGKKRKAFFRANFVSYGSHTDWQEIETVTAQRDAGV